MSSEQLADGVNPLDAELAATWDVLKGYSGRDTDLGIARRFGDAAAAYSLRDIGAMNGRVVKVRREQDTTPVDFSAGAIASGGLESYTNETVNMYTSNFATTDGFSANQGAVASVDGIGGKDDVLGFTLNTANSSFHMAFKNIATSNETVRVQGEIYIPSSNNKVDSVAIFIDGGGSTTQIGSTLVPTADQWVAFDVTGQVSGAKIHFRAKDGGTFTIEDTGGDDVFYLANVTVDATQSSGYVSKWYDQSGNGRDMAQIDTDDQPRIVNSGTLETLGGKPTVKFLNVGTGLGSTFLERGGITGQTEVAYFGVVSLDNADVTRPTFVGTGSDFAGTSAEKLTLRYNGSSTFTSGESIPTGELVSIGAVVPTSLIPTLYVNSTSQTKASAFTGTSSTINQILGENSTSAGNDTFGLQGTISEMVIYTIDVSAEADDIRNDSNNYYSIY